MSRLQITLISIGVLTVLTFIGLNVVYESDTEIPQEDTSIIKKSIPEPVKEPKQPINSPVLSDKDLINALDKLLKSKIKFAKDAKGYRDPQSMDYVKIIDKRYILCGTLLAKNKQFMLDLVRNKSKTSEQFIGYWKYHVKRTENNAYAYLYGVASTCERINFYTSRTVYGSFEAFSRDTSPLWFIIKEDPNQKEQIIGKISIDGEVHGYNKITTGWYPPYYYR